MFRAISFAFCVVGLCLIALGGAVAQEIPADLRSSVEEAVGKVKPALVRIHVVSTRYNNGRELKQQSWGSGVIITPEGHVVTNHHVAGHAKRLVCTMTTKEEVTAELIGTDELSDIAVIKLENDGTRTYPVAHFGNSNQLKVGDHVLAMGSPMALSQSVTLGIVSNSEMIMPRRFGRLELDGEDVGSFVRWIGHDAAIYGGNSGGPLVNLEGEIIGINEISMALSGAIPGNLARAMAEVLIREGRVKRSWLGVQVQARLKHSAVDSGVLVSGTIADSPAAAAGFEAGDMLVSLSGAPIDVKFAEQLPAFNRMTSELPIGESVEAKVIRDGAEVTVAIKPIEREKRAPKQHEFKQWGITSRNLSELKAKEMKRDNNEGALVTSVNAGGPAGDAKPKIQREDVIVSVGGDAVKSVEDLRRVTDELTEGKTELTPTLVEFTRKLGLFMTVVELGVKEPEEPGVEVTKAWLPVETQVLTRDISEHLEDPELTGFRVTQVYKGSTAETAGLEVGDFIVAVDGERMLAFAPEDYEELPALIRQYKVGAVTDLTVLRDGERMTVPVELAPSPKKRREMKEYADENFEFTVRDITFNDKAQERWQEAQRGVLVEEVKPGSWAALALLNVNDLIVDVNGAEIVDVESFETAMTGISDAKPDVVVIRVRRGIYNLFVELEPKWDAS
jgi:serine protease Do